MNEIRLAGWAASSSSPTEVSNRIKGIVMAGSSLVVLLGSRFFGLELTTENVMELSTQLGALGGAGWAVWGAVMALVRWVAKVRS